MLDAKLIRNEPDKVRQALINRNETTDHLDEFLALDEKRRAILFDVEQLKSERNTVSDHIAKMKMNKENADDEIKRMRDVSQQIKQMDTTLSDIEAQINPILMTIPNMPSATTPIGKNETDNVIVRSWQEPKKFDFEPAAHWDLATALDMIDFERGSKISGSGFILYKKWGARLERSLFNWMLDVHTSEHGYTEVFPPLLVNRKAMQGTGQLPKFEEDMYRCDKDDDLFLIPTAEVPLTNIYMDEILDAEQLPICLTAFSACFRREKQAPRAKTPGVF